MNLFMEFKNLSKSHFTRPAILFLLAFLIRFVYCQNRWWLAGDSSDYLDIARNLTLFDSFAFTNPNGGIVLTAFRPFLYPFFLSLFGSNQQMILLVQCVLGALTVVLTYFIAREFGRKVGLIAALMMCFAPMTICYTGTVLSETLFTFLVIMGCWEWGRHKWLQTGIAFGLASLTKPVIFPFLVFVLLFVIIIPSLRSRIKGYAILTACVLLISSFWVVRNTMLVGHFTLTQSSGYGTNLLFGSMDTTLYGDDLPVRAKSDPAVQVDPSLSESEQDKARFNLALSRIWEHPFDWLRVRAIQYPRLFLDSGANLLGEEDELFGDAITKGDYIIVAFKSLFMMGSVLFLLLVAAGAYSIRTSLALYPHIWMFPLFLALVHLPMWTESRYLLPASPLMCVFASIFIRRKLTQFA